MGTTIRSELSKKNEYWIEKHRYYELKHFCMQYPIWKKLIDYIDSMGHVSDSEIKTKNISDPVLRCVEQRDWYISNCKMIERTANETDSVVAPYLLKGITEGLSYDTLNMQEVLPFSKSRYYEMYRKFFWLLDYKRK